MRSHAFFVRRPNAATLLGALFWLTATAAVVRPVSAQSKHPTSVAGTVTMNTAVPADGEAIVRLCASKVSGESAFNKPGEIYRIEEVKNTKPRYDLVASENVEKDGRLDYFPHVRAGVKLTEGRENSYHFSLPRARPEQKPKVKFIVEGKHDGDEAEVLLYARHCEDRPIYAKTLKKGEVSAEIDVVGVSGYLVAVKIGGRRSQLKPFQLGLEQRVTVSLKVEDDPAVSSLPAPLTARFDRVGPPLTPRELADPGKAREYYADEVKRLSEEIAGLRDAIRKRGEEIDSMTAAAAPNAGANQTLARRSQQR